MSYPYEYQSANSSGLKPPKIRHQRVSPLVLIVVGIIATAIILLITAHLQFHGFNLPTKHNSTAEATPFKEVEAETLYETNFKASLNQSEKDVIHLLRNEVEDKVTHEFMKTDSYLIRWLRAREWDVEDATEMLMKHLEWREEYDMDNIFTDNFTYFQNEYPIYMDGYDYNKGPVVSLNSADLDLKKVAVSGNERQFLRYLFRQFELGIKYIYECQAKGLNVSQGVLIINLDMFTIKQHGCFSCLPILTSFLFGMDDNYPGWMHHILLINTPDIADVVLDLVVAYLSGENRDAFKTYGFNKQEWQPKILSLIPADQIRPEFGGTKLDSSI